MEIKNILCPFAELRVNKNDDELNQCSCVHCHESNYYYKRHPDGHTKAQWYCSHTRIEFEPHYRIK
jgi:hypothetical protein